jgi:arginyl-tRNA synthetase
MKTNIQQLILKTLQNLQQSGKLSVDLSAVQSPQIDRTKDSSHGDYASNIAMILSKGTGLKPRDLAQLIVDNLPASADIIKVEIAGPGFINFFVNCQAKEEVIARVLTAGISYGRSNAAQGKRLHIEFVSSNPTGPLHVGHGRGAAYGAAISDLLAAVGYHVHREYYVNDAGRQMDILATSLWLRYLEALGEKLIFPSNAYKGDYVKEIAEQLKSQHGNHFHKKAIEVFNNLPADEPQGGDKDKYIDAIIEKAKIFLDKDYAIVHQFGLQLILADMRQDLSEFGVNYQEWFSERSLSDKGLVQHALDVLKQKDYLYEKDGATWFKSTLFGDEKDRVLVRENGQMTYFAPDIAYHLTKIERGFDRVIDVLGADHHGYIPRIRAAMRALGADDSKLDVPLVQFVSLFRGKEKASMSTRSGDFVTLRELRAEVGNDAARFFYIMRKIDQPMDFDLDLAKSHSNDNPVYYIQYAHARICSVFRQLEEKNFQYDEKLGLDSLSLLKSSYEAALLDDLDQYPEVISNAAKYLDPQLVANYLRQLAQDFHAYYNCEQFIVDDAAYRNARLLLIKATRQVLLNGLHLLGVSAPEKM